jgi:hypothetical protein
MRNEPDAAIMATLWTSSRSSQASSPQFNDRGILIALAAAPPKLLRQLRGKGQRWNGGITFANFRDFQLPATACSASQIMMILD